MTARLEAFIPAHMEGFVPRAPDSETFTHPLDAVVRASQYSAQGYAYSLVSDQGTIAVIGLVVLGEGVGEAWVITTTLVDSYKYMFCKSVLRLIDKAEQAGFHRVQVIVRADYQKSIAWFEWMGFACEGMMRAYIGKLDYYRYAKVVG